MSGRRSEDPLNGDWSDEALARAVEQALDVRPAPEFLARVRTRVASQPTLPPAWARWPVGIGAAAVVSTCLVAAMWLPAREAARPAVRDAGRITDRQLASSEAAGAGRHVDEGEEVGRPAAPGSVTNPAVIARDMRGPVGASAQPVPSHFLAVMPVELQLPEVVLSPRERRAIQMLLNPPASRAPNHATAAIDELVIPDLPSLAALDVPAVEVTPIAQIATAEGGRP